ncbi:MAG TPA: hypothetical protein VGO47_08955, partial [Chlamydiales bacterium]|nr:hypothetical protein [Chlamydiales bacterium]
MTNWKLKYCTSFSLCDGTSTKLGKCNCKKQLNFISKEIIEKLIADIPDNGLIQNQGLLGGTSTTENLKQQLRDNWLGESNSPASSD